VANPDSKIVQDAVAKRVMAYAIERRRLMELEASVARPSKLSDDLLKRR
jgi:hypothetical protein